MPLDFSQRERIQSFSVLNSSIPKELDATTAILDGELVCLDDSGKPQFRDLLFRKREPRFVVFDVVYCNGQDLRYAPLMERKQKLRSILPTGNRIMYCDHLENDGEGLFR